MIVWLSRRGWLCGLRYHGVAPVAIGGRPFRTGLLVKAWGFVVLRGKGNREEHRPRRVRRRSGDGGFGEEVAEGTEF